MRKAEQKGERLGDGRLRCTIAGLQRGNGDRIFRDEQGEIHGWMEEEDFETSVMVKGTKGDVDK